MAGRLPLALLFVSLASAAPQKGAEILWDRYGVAHVYARSTAGLFYCYGWAQAQSHGDLLLHLYGESRGRAAEYFGPAGIENDEWVWTNRVPQRSVEWLDRQTPEFRGYLEAFAQGINDYAAAHLEVISAESRRVLPVTALDPLQHTHRIVHFTYIANPRLQATGSAPVTAASLLETPEAVGSNGWAVAPSRTAARKALLLGNPHLPWGGWQTYYEIHLTAPGIDLYGASQVGFPVLRFVFSNYLGFNQTVNSIDGVDLYRIHLQGEGYLLDGKVMPFQAETHNLKIRRPEGTFTTRALAIRRTVHGPIVKQEGGAPVAMRVAGLDRPFMLEQYWQMETAHSFAAFEKALSRLQVPCFNIIYADRDGHIEYLYNGLLPRRSSGDLKFWAGIVPGDTSTTLWNDYLTYAELPKSIDPPGGFVQNTNDPPWNNAWPATIDPAGYPPYIAPPAISFRAERSLRMLYDDSKLTFESFIGYKHSTRSELADRILPDLLAAVGQYGGDLGVKAAAVLRGWDRQTEAQSKGAVLFLAWATRFMGGPTLASQAGFAVPYDLRQPLTTPRGLRDPRAAAAQLEEAAAETLKNHGALDIPWGEVMRFQHAGLDLPANGGFGNLGIFRVITFGALHGKTRSQTHGETYIAAVEFANPVRARVLLTYGNSSQPGSPHRSDQLPLLAAKQLRTAWLTRSDVEANLESRQKF